MKTKPSSIWDFQIRTENNTDQQPEQSTPQTAPEQPQSSNTQASTKQTEPKPALSKSKISSLNVKINTKKYKVQPSPERVQQKEETAEVSIPSTQEIINFVHPPPNETIGEDLSQVIKTNVKIPKKIPPQDWRSLNATSHLTRKI